MRTRGIREKVARHGWTILGGWVTTFAFVRRFERGMAVRLER